AARPRRDHLSKTEIEDLSVTQFGHKKVCWLDVSMDYALCVCCPKRIANLNRQFQHFLERKRLARNAMFEGLPVEKLHRNERLTFVFADFIDGANIWMVQGGGSLCLTVEAA